MSTLRLLSLCLLLASSGAVVQDSPTIDLGYAVYQGTTLEVSGVNQYLGMRFASPPLGNLRFRAPTSPAAEEGIQDATVVR